jgi:hypothetical protein
MRTCASAPASSWRMCSIWCLVSELPPREGRKRQPIEHRHPPMATAQEKLETVMIGTDLDSNSAVWLTPKVLTTFGDARDTESTFALTLISSPSRTTTNRREQRTGQPPQVRPGGGLTTPGPIPHPSTATPPHSAPGEKVAPHSYP